MKVDIKSIRNWKEDFSHENGCYQNKCCYCNELFFGHKRRPFCKQCAVLKIAKVGDLIKYTLDPSGNYPDYLKGKTFELPVLMVDTEDRCYGVYASYGQDLIPFDECEIIT